MAQAEHTPEPLVQPHYSLLSALGHGSLVYSFRALLVNPLNWAREWHAYLYPSRFAPDYVKTYECSPLLPIRIFFPKSYDKASGATLLPTLFNIHGGGFVIGNPIDDDECNRALADAHGLLVVALNYGKAPWYPFPQATLDAAALMLAAHDDASLPIDKARVAVGGYSAGGGLCLSVCQVPEVRARIALRAAVPVYPVVDHSLATGAREARRQYKPQLDGNRGSTADHLTPATPYVKWSYIPYGQDLRDPLLSPLYAPRDSLPPHIFVVAAELDQLAHEAWEMASALAGRRVPAATEKAGQEEPGKAGELILDDERFAFEHADDDDGGRSVRWLLVPDVLHGFDHLPLRMQGSQTSLDDAKVKTVAYQKIVGEWLLEVLSRAG